MFWLQKVSVFLVFLLIAGWTGCREETPESGAYLELQPQEVKRLMEQNGDVIIIDVRTPEEFVGPLGHIPGAVLRPVKQIDDWVYEFSYEKDKRFIMVCRSGNRSRTAAKYFSRKGFQNVYNMKGGMRTWNELNFPTEKTIPEEFNE